MDRRITEVERLKEENIFLRGACINDKRKIDDYIKAKQQIAELEANIIEANLPRG